MRRRLQSRDLLARAAMWIATLQDDAHHLRARAKTKDATAAERKALERLARALSDAAAILQTGLPAAEAGAKRSTRRKKK